MDIFVSLTGCWGGGWKGCGCSGLSPPPPLAPPAPPDFSPQSMSMFSACVVSSNSKAPASGTNGTLYVFAISSKYFSTRIFGGAWTPSLCINFSLTLLRLLLRQLWANSLPYLAVSWSDMTLSSATSPCRRGVAQMMVAMGSSNPSSSSLQTNHSAVTFLPNHCKRYPIAHPWGSHRENFWAFPGSRINLAWF